MKKIIFSVLFAVVFIPSKSFAQSAWDKGYSTWTAIGIFCTTGTSVQLNATRQLIGFNIGGYRINNLDGADAVYVGNAPSVSTFSATAVALAQLGERIASGGSTTYELGLNPDLADQPDVELWCRAVDAAGTASALLNLVSFGYR